MSQQWVAVQQAKNPNPRVAGTLKTKCSCDQHAGGGECEECRKKEQVLQRRIGPVAQSTLAPSVIHEVIRSAGESLDEPTKTFMGSRFHRNFSQVRIHTNSKATQSAQAVNALAYTVGNHIVFNTGQYSPGTSSGRRLLAHELTHVIQQGAAPRESALSNELSAKSQDTVGRSCLPQLKVLRQPILQRQAGPTTRPNPDQQLDEVIQAVRTGLQTLQEEQATGAADAGRQKHLENLQNALMRLLELQRSGSPEQKAAVSLQVRALTTGRAMVAGGQVASAQTKAIIGGQAYDHFEQEADLLADRVVGSGSPAGPSTISEVSPGSPNIQRQAETAVIAGGLAAGPPGWVFLAAAALVVTGVGVYYLATREAASSISCDAQLERCLENPMQPSWNRDFGARKDCGACYRECRPAGGAWPYYKCPD